MNLVFTGHVIDRKGELATEWREVQAGVLVGDTLTFSLSKNIKALVARRPGAVYPVELVGDRSYRWCSTLPSDTYDGPEVTGWATADYAVRKQHLVVKQLQTEDPLLTALDPIRAAMRQLPAPQRAQVLARVVGYLSK